MDKILSPIKCRIFKYLEYQGISKTKFFETTSISPSNFKGKGGKSELGGDKIVKILTTYKDIKADWLLLGKGKMVEDSIEESLDKQDNNKVNTLASQVIQLISPQLGDIRTEIGMLMKSLGELRLDLDDIREDYDVTKKEQEEN